MSKPYDLKSIENTFSFSNFNLYLEFDVYSSAWFYASKMNKNEDLDEKLKKLCISPLSEHDTDSNQVA